MDPDGWFVMDIEVKREQLAHREQILNLQAAMAKLPGAVLGDSDACPLTHMFAPGVYARQISIPKGCVIIGKIHKHAHVNIISKGRVRVTTEQGAEILEAPLMWVSEPGTKRAVFAEEDTLWTTIHPTDETDLEKIEEEVIAKEFLDGTPELDMNMEKLK